MCKITARDRAVGAITAWDILRIARRMPVAVASARWRFVSVDYKMQVLECSGRRSRAFSCLPTIRLRSQRQGCGDIDQFDAFVGGG